MTSRSIDIYCDSCRQYMYSVSPDADIPNEIFCDNCAESDKIQLPNETISKETWQKLINDSVVLMRSITKVYGAEKGIQLWNTIADTLDPNLKGDIFFSMIIGDFDNRITVSGIKSNSSKVDVIKALRTVDTRHLGLKEAKDIADELFDNNGTVMLEVEPKKRKDAMRILRGAGCLV